MGTIELGGRGSYNPGGGGYYEYRNDTTEYHYLYDGGTLIAVFDKGDGVDQLYINGAGGGPVAVYDNNNSAMRYYFIKDQIGNTRVMVNDTGRVVYYANYYPFGNIQTSYVAYNEPLKFTGKERDKYRDFEYDYFGARYYDPDIGMFSSVDKAAQLASGFNYCGNNPVMMVDPDGNYPWLAWMLYSMYSGGVMSKMRGGEFWEGALQGAVSGYVSGAMSCAISPYVTSVESGIFSNSIASSISGGISSAMTGGNVGKGMLYGGIQGVVSGYFQGRDAARAIKQARMQAAFSDRQYASTDNRLILADLYRLKNSNTIRQFSPGKNPGENWIWVGPDPIDIFTKKPIDLEIQEYDLDDFTETFYNLDERATSFMSSVGYFERWNELRNVALNLKGRPGVDIKTMVDPALYRFYTYIYVDGYVIQIQDAGNFLFGHAGRAGGFSLNTLKIGAGLAQITGRYSKVGPITSYFDDPRDQYFIKKGFFGW